MKQARNPETIHPPVGRYVHQIEVFGESRVLFVPGQVGRRLDMARERGLTPPG